MGIAVFSGICRASFCGLSIRVFGCMLGEQVVDVREGKRLWLYGRGNGCGCTGGEQVVDVC